MSVSSNFNDEFDGMEDESMDSTEHVYESFSFRSFKRVIKGPADYVERRMNETLQYLTPERLALLDADYADSKTLTLPESDTPSLADDGASHSNDSIIELESNLTIDLCTFYREKAPKSKADGVKVITSYYRKYRNKVSVTYSDFDEAYRELARIGVEEPGNIRTAVRNAINSKHLYRVDKEEGHFALTDQGVEFVENMKGE